MEALRGGMGQQCSGQPFLPPQIGHRDFDVEKRLRRDLRRTRALLADVQLLVAAPAEPSASAQDMERLRRQVGAALGHRLAVGPCERRSRISWV